MPDQDICAVESQCLVAACKSASTREAFANIEMQPQAGEWWEGLKENYKQSYKDGLLCVLT